MNYTTNKSHVRQKPDNHVIIEIIDSLFQTTRILTVLLKDHFAVSVEDMFFLLNCVGNRKKNQCVENSNRALENESSDDDLSIELKQTTRHQLL